MLSLVLSGMLLGTGGLTGTLLRRATGLSPVSVAAYRLAVGGVLILLYLVLAGRRLPRGRAAWCRIALVGLLTAGYQACFFGSVALTSVSLATLVTIGTAPVLVLAVEWRLGWRVPDLPMVGTVTLALTGLVLLVGLPHKGSAAGTGLAVLSAAGFAAVTLVGSRPVPGLDALGTIGPAFSVGGLALLGFAGSTVGLSFRPGPTALGLLLLLGTAPTAVAYPLYFHGLRTAGAGTGALLVLLEPLTAAVLAALMLGDRLGPAGTAGAVLLAAAVALAARVSVTPVGSRRRGRPSRRSRRRSCTGTGCRPGPGPARPRRGTRCRRSSCGWSAGRHR
jgi:drug/metabolite transporter, DME family